jgi:hypothetical protein
MTCVAQILRESDRGASLLGEGDDWMCVVESAEPVAVGLDLP